MKEEYLSKTPVYGRSEFAQSAPKLEIPEHSMAPDSAYELLRDELLLDARAGLNLATFVNTACPDPWALKLINENLQINFIDHEEYPASNLAEKRCIWMLAKALGTRFDPNDKDPDTAKGLYGSATIGSSEAVMLGLIAHKYKWIENNKKSSKADPHDRPVVLMSAHVHGCWDKFCRYYGAVPLYIPILDPPYAIDGDTVKQILSTPLDGVDSIYSDQIQKTLGYTAPQSGRTIGELVMCVGAVVGSTFTGNSDDVESIDAAVEEYCREAHEKLYLDIPIHVDAASASFVSIFASNGPELRFDFSVTRQVRSINISNHKFGFTLPGMGSVVFRDSTVVHEDLVYHITYLGGNFIDYTVNFSRGASMILMQYFNFLRFGRAGYRKVIDNCLANAAWFAKSVHESLELGGLLKTISDWEHLPIVILTWSDPDNKPPWDLAVLSSRLRGRGWVVPAYVLPKDSPDQNLKPNEGTQVLRVVVQQAVTRDKLSRLLIDLEASVHELEKSREVPASEPRFVTGFTC